MAAATTKETKKTEQRHRRLQKPTFKVGSITAETRLISIESQPKKVVVVVVVVVVDLLFCFCSCSCILLLFKVLSTLGQ